MLDYDHLGRKVILMRPGCFDPYRHRPEDMDKVSFMVSDVMGLEDEQMFVTGIVIVIDLEGYSLAHVTQRPLALTKKHMRYLQVFTPFPNNYSIDTTGEQKLYFMIPKITLVLLDWLQFLSYRHFNGLTFFGNFFFVLKFIVKSLFLRNLMKFGKPFCEFV